MDFGLVLQTDPPASRVVSLMKRAERNGFHYGWTFDSAVLWQEPFVIYSQILANTQKLKVGPMVTNPGTRTWEVTASTFATPQRHVRQPHRLRHRPRRLRDARRRPAKPTPSPGSARP